MIARYLTVSVLVSGKKVGLDIWVESLDAKWEISLRRFGTGKNKRKYIKAAEVNNCNPMRHLRSSKKAALFKGLSQQPELHRHFGKLGLEIRSANLLWHLKFPALRIDYAVG